MKYEGKKLLKTFLENNKTNNLDIKIIIKEFSTIEPLINSLNKKS